MEDREIISMHELYTKSLHLILIGIFTFSMACSPNGTHVYSNTDKSLSLAKVREKPAPHTIRADWLNDGGTSFENVFSAKLRDMYLGWWGP